MPTHYEVQVMKEWNKWEPYFTSDIEQAAECVAGYKSTGNVHVRILEMTFSNGRLKEIKEYKVNPPHCSNNGLPPRGPEKVLRGYLPI